MFVLGDQTTIASKEPDNPLRLAQNGHEALSWRKCRGKLGMKRIRITIRVALMGVAIRKQGSGGELFHEMNILVDWTES